MIYRNAISENNTQTPNMGKGNIILQLAFSFNIEIDKIDNINEDFYLYS